jgi:hypothetical protein
VAHPKPLLIAGLLAFALTVAAAAQANQIRLNRADQARARAAVVHKADLGGNGWSGGVKKPDLASGSGCVDYHPKDSDLVTTGAAETEFTNGALTFDSEVLLLETATMVGADWHRSVRPAALSCLKELFARELGGKARIVSAARTGFTPIARYTANFRVVFDVNAGGRRARILVDVLLVGKGRAELTLTTIAPYAARVAVEAAELRLARRVAGRLPRS